MKRRMAMALLCGMIGFAAMMTRDAKARYVFSWDAGLAGMPDSGWQYGDTINPTAAYYHIDALQDCTVYGGYFDFELRYYRPATSDWQLIAAYDGPVLTGTPNGAELGCYFYLPYRDDDHVTARVIATFYYRHDYPPGTPAWTGISQAPIEFTVSAPN